MAARAKRWKTKALFGSKDIELLVHSWHQERQHKNQTIHQAHFPHTLYYSRYSRFKIQRFDAYWKPLRGLLNQGHPVIEANWWIGIWSDICFSLIVSFVTFCENAKWFHWTLLDKLCVISTVNLKIQYNLIKYDQEIRPLLALYHNSTFIYLAKTMSMCPLGWTCVHGPGLLWSICDVAHFTTS